MSIFDTNWDVAVIGGGMAGCMAAIAAAEAGKRVVLVERYTALGGMATMGLVQPMTVWGLNDRYAIGGLGKRLLDDLHERIPEACSPVTHYGPTCDAEYLKHMLETTAVKTGVRLLYHAWASGVEKDGNRIAGVRLTTKGGIKTLRASVYVDGSGDADVAALAGVPCDVDSQGITLMFVMAGIDRSREPENMKEVWTAHNDATYRGPLHFWHPSRPDCAFFNMTEVEGMNALDAEGLTEATVECRRQAWRILEIMREHVPGYEKAYIEQTAPALGVRETRRIRGVYCLTESDLENGAEFDDTVARGCSPLDVHGSDDSGKKRYEWLKQSHGIPYRSLIAKEAENLIVVGRPISADHAAHSALRRMATGCGIGEAGGVAAALAAESGSVHAVDVTAVRQTLATRGAVLEE